MEQVNGENGADCRQMRNDGNEDGRQRLTGRKVRTGKMKTSFKGIESAFRSSIGRVDLCRDRLARSMARQMQKSNGR